MAPIGVRWNELPPHMSHEQHGLILLQIKAWRAAQFQAGNPSSLDDFYAAHELCKNCGCLGACYVGWDEQTDVHMWEICPICLGTGKPTSQL